METKNNEKDKYDVIKKILVGLFAGVISGFFGSGGGMIVVPALIYILKIPDVKARATSVFSIMPMVIASGVVYMRNDLINWELGIKCAIGGLIGGMIGAKLLTVLSTKTLRISFTIFLIYSSIRLII